MIAGGRVKVSRRQREEMVQKIVADILQALGKAGARPQPLVTDKPRKASTPKSPLPLSNSIKKSQTNSK